MKEVYLAYDITDCSEFVEVFKKKEDAENYIREKALKHTMNRNDLMILDGRDYNGNLYLSVMYQKEHDPAYQKYAELHVVKRDLR